MGGVVTSLHRCQSFGECRLLGIQDVVTEHVLVLVTIKISSVVYFVKTDDLLTANFDQVNEFQICKEKLMISFDTDDVFLSSFIQLTAF